MPQTIKIRIIEDNLEEWELIKRSLSKYGVENYEFYDTALKALASLPPDPPEVIVLDYLLRKDVFNGDKIIHDAKVISPDSYFIIVSEIFTEEILFGFVKARAEDALKKSDRNYHDKLVEAMLLGRQEVRNRIDKNNQIKEAKEWLEEKAKSLTQKIEKL